ncbi:MAG: universal stress protein [Bacteroidia bacterium]
MKKILIPTDFSDCAGYALDTAVKLAEKFGSELHIYHRADIDPAFDESSTVSQQESMESYAMLQFIKKKYYKIREQYASSNLRIITTFSSGDLVKTVTDYISTENIDMVVMGSSGASGLKGMVMGSQTQKIVRNAYCPVLVVKHPVNTVIFKNIVFASDFSDLAKKPFEKLIEFARKFGSHIHLLNVAAYPKFTVNEEDLTRMKAFEKMCWALPCTVYGRGDVDLELGVTHFAKEVKADLVSIAHFGKEPIKRVFTGSLTENLVNHLETPVLTINANEVKSWKVIKDPEEDIPLKRAKVTSPQKR